MGKGNSGCALDLSWFEDVAIDKILLKEQVEYLKNNRQLTGNCRTAWLLRALTCIDLTTLAGDDSESNVSRLCEKAVSPLPTSLLKSLGFGDDERITTAAVCVYPLQVKCAEDVLRKHGDKIGIASVAAGFPSGQFPLSSRLQEIRFAVESGATEIDIVLYRPLVLRHEWEKLYDEIKQMKEACGNAHLKTIVSAGELGSFENIYKASMVAMMAGSDFIKTSTGKETINATLPIGIVMCRAIADFHMRTGIKVGFKPAGGIRTATDSLQWLILMKEELGHDWLYPDLFRIGASGLLADIERELHKIGTGYSAPVSQFAMC